jgi:hypothetical protein
MQVTAMLPSNFLQLRNSSGSSPNRTPTEVQFQQLGQDLRAGNLTQARQDFSTLLQQASSGLHNGPLANGVSAVANSTLQQAAASPLSDVLGVLKTGLRFTGVSAVQQAYSLAQ